MRHTLAKRVLPLLCAAAMALTLLPLPSFAANVQHETAEEIGRGLTATVLKSKNDSSSRQMVRLDYTPGLGVTPIVGYGSKLYGKSDVNYVISYAEARGNSVLAAVNADYFHVDTGVPTGMLINNGRLCVSDGAWNAVGFFADGTAICGTPRLKVTYYRPLNGGTYTIEGLNKVRTTTGIYMYTDDFSSDTRTTAAGTEVVLQSAHGEYLALGKPLELTVVSVGQRSATPIAPGQFVLSLNDSNVKGTRISDMQPGETITVSASTADTRWHSVVYSCGGGNMLASNSTLTPAATREKDARTVIGVRADGSFSVIVCDGRQGGLSDGISLDEAARTLIASGCVNVINMDGGGSSSASVRFPGQNGASIITSPSDGAPRKCANFLLFVNSGDRTLPNDRAAVYPRTAAVLAGASMPVSALTYNGDYFPGGEYSGELFVSGGEGEVSNGIFYSGYEAGVSYIDVDSGGFYGSPAVIDVVASPARISFVRAGTSAALSTLAVAPDSVTDLDMYATDGLRRLVSQDAQFTFEVSGGIGSVDGNGVFVSTGVPGTNGTITAYWNEYILTLPVKVGQAPQVIEGFETARTYTAATLPPAPTDPSVPVDPAVVSLSTASANVINAPENARYGNGALVLGFHAVQIGDTAAFTPDKAYTFPAGATHLSMMIRGKGTIGIVYNSPTGQIKGDPMAVTDEWNFYTAAIPAGATGIAGFYTIAYSVTDYKICVDQLTCYFGKAIYDHLAPRISDLAYDGADVTATVLDDYPIPMTADMLKLTVDGRAVPLAYDAATGLVTAQLPLDEARHRITLTARDFTYNMSRASIDSGASQSHVFSDTTGIWFGEYAEYLSLRGVFSKDTKFNPQMTVTNAMAATIISRYLGAETAKYETQPLPYIDSADIPDWALPHVRAMFSMGIMVGGYDNAGNRIFSPNASTTRAQVMTILGRTVQRGYNYQKSTFGDRDTIPYWAADHIDLLYGMGVINGYTGSNDIKPLLTITRAELASLLYKFY